MFQTRLHDENTDVHLGHAPTANKDVLMSAKKTAFSDVKNLLGNTNTPGGLPSKTSGLKKPVFGSQFKANGNPAKVAPSETKSQVPSAARLKKNYKPRIGLSTIDYSDNEPHVSCKSSSSSSGQRDFLSSFWSAAAASSNSFDIYQDTQPVRQRSIDLPELAPSLYTSTSNSTHVESIPDLFDDIPQLSFCTTFSDL